MSPTHDDRDDDRDWPEEPVIHPAEPLSPDAPEPPEPEDDAAHLPVRPAPRRRPPTRKRGTYQPPSELDGD